MITDFRDFCLWSYVVVDDIWQHIAPLFRRPGPQPTGCSDSELLTMALVAECRGWDEETEAISQWQEYRDLFPHIPERSRFNRRRRNLAQAFNLLRRMLVQMLDVAYERYCTIDSLPVSAVQFHLVPSSPNDWKAYGASYGKVSSKKQTIFGYKLHLLVTVGGVILDFELAPAHAADLTIGAEILEEHTDRIVIGDKAYVSAPLAAQLKEHNRVHLLTLPRANQRKQLPPAVCRIINQTRQIVETVNSQLTEQLHVERNHAVTFDGLCARLYTKLTAHTLCIYLNRLLGNPEWLQIKRLAFPI